MLLPLSGLGLGRTQPASATGSVLLRFSPLYMGGSQRFTQTDAIAIAKQFNVIAEHAYEGWRFVLDDSTFRAADGLLKLWGRADARQDSTSLQMRLAAEKIAGHEHLQNGFPHRGVARLGLFDQRVGHALGLEFSQ